MLKNISLSIASATLGLIIIELALRLLGWSFPIFMRPDGDLGWSFRARISGWSTHENVAHLRINRFGFRGNDWPETPMPGTFRVAVIGDSFVEASNLPEGQALTGVIEEHLAACPALYGGRAEILNLGVSGYGTAQEYLLLRRVIELAHPHLVLLAFYAGNDVANNSRALSYESQREKPYFLTTASGELHLDASFHESDKFRRALSRDWQAGLVNSVHLLQLLKQLWQRKPISPPSDASQRAFGTTLETHANAKPEYPQLFSPPHDEDWRLAWTTTEHLLLAARDRTIEKKSDFGLLVIPAPVQVLPSEDMRRAASQEFELANLDYPIERIVNLAVRNEIPYLNLLADLRDYADSNGAYLYGFPPQFGNGHLNAIGNEVSGRSIAKWLCSRFGGTGLH